MAVMREAALEADRDPDAIEVTAGSAAVFAPDAVDQIKQLEADGISRLVIPPLTYNTDDIGDVLGTFGENVISKTR
jgi:hypothetical protein